MKAKFTLIQRGISGMLPGHLVIGIFLDNAKRIW